MRFPLALLFFAGAAAGELGGGGDVPPASPPSPPESFSAFDYDLLVYGATPAGIAAAITAANASTLRVVLLEPSSYVGGMSGPGGIGLRDTADPAAAVTGGPRSVMAHWLAAASAAYGGAHVRQPDEAVAMALWEALVAAPAYNLSVFRNVGLDFERPGSVLMAGSRITAIRTIDPRDGGAQRTWTARWFVDASYEADIVQNTPGLAWTIGRESRAQYGEPLAGVLPAPAFQRFRATVDPFWPNGTLLDGVEPSANMPPAGGADDRVMPSSYRACITDSPILRAPWPKPENYDESKYELLIRLTEALSKPPTLSDLAGVYEYFGYPATPERPMRYDLCENSELSTDQPSHTYTEYILGNYSTRARIRAVVRDWVAGWAYTLANAPRVPAATRSSVSSWGLCKDAWPENGNWPLQMYVREGVRLVGDRVATQVNTVTGACVPDAVALGAWSIDIHLMRRFNGTRSGAPSTENEGEVGFAKFPGNGTVYELPLSSILPQRAQATNLAAPVTPSASHVAFGSIRVEPVFLALGTAAGAAVRVAQQTGAAALADVDIGALQAALKEADQCFHWDAARGACADACA